MRGCCINAIAASPNARIGIPIAGATVAKTNQNAAVAIFIQ